MRRALFVTGTGTDVGKTIVTASLLRALRQRGINAATMKPVQTGAYLHDGHFVAPDLEVHWRGADWTPPAEQHSLMAPFLYEHACSPHLAARESGRPIDTGTILAAADKLLEQYELLLIEGAGGLMVPLGEQRMMPELIRELDCPTLLVAMTGLGTINHTLLSVNQLQSDGREIAGIVYCQTAPAEDPAIEADNPPMIEKLSACPTLGVLPYRATEAWDDWAASIGGLDRILDITRAT